jgi:hypothetical protein
MRMFLAFRMLARHARQQVFGTATVATVHKRSNVIRGSVMYFSHPRPGQANPLITARRSAGLRVASVVSTDAGVSSHDVAAPSTAADPGASLGSSLSWPARSHGCGELGEAQVGEEVTVCGWVDRYRNLGAILFLDIRDHTGIVQVRALGGVCGRACVLTGPNRVPAWMTNE